MEAKQRDLDLPTGLVSVVESGGFQDEAWDSFLRNNSVGQFQQSSAWARAKAVEGWRPDRVTLRIGERIIGGFQLLWRRTRLGRVGYVSKGPVLEVEDPVLAASLIQLLRKSVARLRCLAVIIQPPDFSKVFQSLLDGSDYVENKLVGVIDATLLVSLDQGIASVERTLRRSTRRDLKLGAKRGLKFIEGVEDQLPEFHTLMKSTCERQGVQPNPASVEQLRSLWGAFAPRSEIALSFVVLDGELVCGGLSIKFGARWTHWKRGWSGRHPGLCPNDFLVWEIIKSALRTGFKDFDFASIQRRTAEMIMKGESVLEGELSNRDRFHLGFGGRPVLLPDARLWIPNRLLRRGYQALVWLRRSPAMEGSLRRRSMIGFSKNR